MDGNVEKGYIHPDLALLCADKWARNASVARAESRPGGAHDAARARMRARHGGRWAATRQGRERGRVARARSAV
jgi:hypothetical protein